MAICEYKKNTITFPPLNMSGLQKPLDPWIPRVFSDPSREDPAGNEEPLIKLPTLLRTPHEIIQRKMSLERQRDESKESKLNTTIEREIKCKLNFLNVIQNLKGSSYFGSRSKQISELESKTLLLGLADRTQQLQQAEFMTQQILEQMRNLQKRLEQEEAVKVELYRTVTEKKSFHNQTLDLLYVLHEENNIKEMSRDQPTIKDNALSSSPNVNHGCIQFSNLFSISGQLVEFCYGEYGSKFAINRLKNGTDPERSLLRTELELPEKLTKHLTNSHCRKVILTLALTDKVSKEELLRQIKCELDVILSLDGGREFVQDLLN